MYILRPCSSRPRRSPTRSANAEAVETLVKHFRSLGGETLLHIHNHSLGKSPAVAELARDGMHPDTPFNQVVSSADACITTSVGEGFGMSFLEPYLMNRPLFGRDLPDITAGFNSDGIRLEGLYNTLPVPLDSLDPDFWPRAHHTVNRYRATLGIPSPLDLPALQTAWVTAGQIDFGRLDETVRTRLLRT